MFELMLQVPASKLSGALWRQGRKSLEGEPEGELAAARLEFEYLHRKSRCEILIGGDDTRNDVITLGTYFSMFVYIRADWRKSDSSVDGAPQGNWGWNSNFRDVVASSSSFCRPAARMSRRACSQYSLLFALRQSRVDLMAFQTSHLYVRTSQELDFP